MVSTKTRRLRELLRVALGQQEIGRRIAQARDDAGLTQQDLADLIQAHLPLRCGVIVSGSDYSEIPIGGPL